MEYPNMEPEVIDAIHLMYEDNPDVEADCYLYLQSLKRKYYTVSRLTSLSNAAYRALQNMGRCPNCGNIMKSIPYKEYHSEVDAYETLYDIYCPYCDIGEN